MAVLLIFIQMEYVTHGAASYIFDVLATRRILEHECPPGRLARIRRYRGMYQQ